MKKIITFVMLMFISLSVYANDIYITQSGNALDLDVTQDGQNNTKHPRVKVASRGGQRRVNR